MHRETSGDATKPGRVVIRAATEVDSRESAAMMEAANQEDGQPPGRYREEIVRRDGCGPDRAFSALLACIEGVGVGYVLFLPFYNTEIAQRGLWMLDLWVEPRHRRLGVGRRLLANLARRAVDEKLASVWWTVRNANAAPPALYPEFGPKDDHTRLLDLDGPPP